MSSVSIISVTLAVPLEVAQAVGGMETHVVPSCLPKLQQDPLAQISLNWTKLPNEQTFAVRRTPPSPGNPFFVPQSEFVPSPRSSISSSLSSTTPSQGSPSRGKLPTLYLDAFASPVKSASLAATKLSQRSPQYQTASLYPDTGTNPFSGADFLQERDSGELASSTDTLNRRSSVGVVTLPLDSNTSAAPLPSPPVPTSPHDHTQLALAEIFAGNPRPHYRSASFTQPAGSPTSPQSLLPGTPHSLLTTSFQDSTASRGYFSPPASRARSQSSAPSFDRSGLSLGGLSPTASSYTSLQMQYPPKQPSADQNGYRPSPAVTSSHYSSSLPTSLPHPSLPSPVIDGFYNNLRPTFSPTFGSYSGSLGAGASPSFANGFGGGGGAYDSSTSWRKSQPVSSPHVGAMDFAWDESEREGRGRTRTNEDNLSVSASSAGTGIGYSNMSPFTRDGARTLTELADAGAYQSRREYSLGAVGSGRKRGDTMWGRERPLSDQREEDGEESFFSPTKSGATSRRHSVVGFNHPSRSQVGFTISDDSTGNGFKNTSAPKSSGLAGDHTYLRGGGGLGSSAINDDDLASDLNSLHLNLESHAASHQESGHSSHESIPCVGSLPTNFPSSSRHFDSQPISKSPPQFSPTSAASRFFQPSTTSDGRGGSRFEFGGIGTTSSTVGQASNFTATNGLGYGGSSQLQPPASQIPGRYSSFKLPPPSPPMTTSSFFPSSLAPVLSAQAPAFQSFPQPHSSFYPHASVGHAGQAVSHQVAAEAEFSNLGRGVPLHSIPSNAQLYIVEFKAGRKDLFFVEDPNLHLSLRQGDLVIVEADRGKDIGKFFKPCSLDEVHAFQQRLVEAALSQLAHPNGGGNGMGSNGNGVTPNAATIAKMTKEFAPKKIFGKALPMDTQMLLSKAQDEIKALALIRSRVSQKNLAMEICDAEWQWDRKKLTFYYLADARIDFRELVRELFRLYKTRIWMCCLDQQSQWDFK